MAKLVKVLASEIKLGSKETLNELEPLKFENEQLKIMIKQRNDDLAHLKLIIEKTNISNIILPLTDEEEIANLQLSKIKLLSRERALTLEEIKMYDLLVKNKRLAQGEVTDITGNRSLTSKSKSELLKIAVKKS